MKADKLSALIALLDDPDKTVYKQVEKELLEENSSIIRQLEQIWETSLDSLIQERIENLTRQIRFRETSKRIQNWYREEEEDLFEGFFLISRYQYPELKSAEMRNRIRRIRSDVWLEINNRLTSIEKITVLNHIFYDVYQFNINQSDVLSPRACFLNHILDTKEGNPVSMAILYTLVARELDFPVLLVDFPKNPLLAYVDEELARKAHGPGYHSQVLFYINPLNRGAIIGRREVEFMLRKEGQVNASSFATPCKDRIIIRKLVESLITAYSFAGRQDKADELTGIVSLL